MRHSPLRLTAAAATAVAATIGLSAGTAFAASGTPTAPSTPSTHKAGKTANVKLPANPTLQQVQAAAATDVNNRVTTLNTAIAKVQKAKDLGSDQATLLHTLQTDVPGLQQLGQKVAADTTVQTATADYMQIFTNYRVYVLVAPVTRAVAVDDRITNAAGPRLTKVAAKIASKETPANQGQVQPLLADLATQVTNGTAAVKGQPATLEAYTPADWNSNHKLLAPVRTTTKTAVADLVKARSDAKQAAADVGLGKGHAKGAATGGTASTPPTTPGASA